VNWYKLGQFVGSSGTRLRGQQSLRQERFDFMIHLETFLTHNLTTIFLYIVILI
jgi:hypothetical protein